MSDDWPQGWYRDRDRDDRPRQPRLSPRDDANPDEQPTRTAHYMGGGDAGRTGWPDQPPSRSAPGRPRPAGPIGPGAPAGPYRTYRTGWRRWLRPKRILFGVVALILILVVAGVVLYFDFNSKLSRAAVLVPTQATSAGTNWLITGSDGRGGLTANEENQMSLGRNVTGARSDTIMILHLPANGTRPTLVSIPRDSYVPIPGHGYNKINAAYAFGGPKLVIATVQNVTGLRIDHYMGIGFDGLVNVVDDVGGVNMCLPKAMKDPKAGLNLKAGCQTLSGKEALGFVRTRAFGTGDLQREQDQRAFLKALLSKMTSTSNIINPFSSIPAAGGAASALTVDSGTQLYQLSSVAFGLRDPVTATVPFGHYANTAAGSVVVWDKTTALQMFNDLANDKALPKSLITGSSLRGTS